MATYSVLTVIEIWGSMPSLNQLSSTYYGAEEEPAWPVFGNKRYRYNYDLKIQGRFVCHGRKREQSTLKSSYSSRNSDKKYLNI